jgi:hypothetical protein
MRHLPPAILVLAALSGPIWLDPTHAQGDDRDRLMSLLIARADAALAASDPALASQIYDLALRFEPGNRDLLARRPREMTFSADRMLAAREALSRIFTNTTVESLRSAMPDGGTDDDARMLRIFLDERLVGDMMYTQGNSGTFSLTFFLATPAITAADVQLTHGFPSATVKNAKGRQELIYGKLRLICDERDRIVAAVTATTW